MTSSDFVKRVWGAVSAACRYRGAWPPRLLESRATSSSESRMSNELEANRQTRKPTWRVSARFCHTYHSALHGLQNLHGHAAILLKKLYNKALGAVGPKPGGKPSNHTVVWALFAFMFFLVFASLSARFPTYEVKTVFVTISSIVICALSILVWRDFTAVSESKIAPRVSARASTDQRRDSSARIPEKPRKFDLHSLVYHDLVDCSVLTGLVSRPQFSCAPNQ